MFQKILVAIDLNHGDAGKALITRARNQLAPKGSLVLLTVIDELASYIAAELPLDITRRREATAKVELNLIAMDLTAQGLEITTEVHHGSPANEILSTANDTGCDLIMIGSHRPGLSDYFIGSTAARVVRHAPTSVLVIR